MCEWLPTRGRDNHSATTFEERTCLWCSNQAVDDSQHAMSCSANKNAADSRWDEVQNLLRGTVRPDVFRRPWIGCDLAPLLVRRAEHFIAHGLLSGDICEQLAQDYLLTRRAESNGDEFIVALARLVEDFDCNCGHAVIEHHCRLRDCFCAPTPFQDLFRRECGLNLELFADASQGGHPRVWRISEQWVMQWCRSGLVSWLGRFPLIAQLCGLLCWPRYAPWQ